MKNAKFIAIIVAVVGLTACSTTTTRTVYVNEDPHAAYRASHGSVTNIEPVQVSGETTGAGAVVGGIVGGVAGHQVGKGRGKDVATVAGVVGGALIGNEIEKRQQGAPDVTRVAIRFDNGSQRNFDYAQAVDLRAGDRVRVDGDRVSRY